MGTIDTSYKPFDPLNLCSLCGDLARKSELRRLPGGLFGCNRASCAGERTAAELDRANARQKPFRILPVPNARPERWNLPDSYEGDEGEILNFCERAVNGQCRYESVTAGTIAPLAGEMLPAFGWMGRYLFGVILENKRPVKMIAKATSLLTSIATLLATRQVGFGLSPSSTRSNDAAYGAFLESGETQYVTENVSTCGVAMLYAYRVTGMLSYRDSARAAASYLRNVQAIGSNGTNFTSSDSAGTARLYTGGVASAVSTASGFYSNSLFCPSDLLTLEFWNALKTTDGDQSIGSTGTPTGFDTIPAQLLSTSIIDMRSFWSSGTRDSAGETYTGLSSTTPREFFNAYPAVKPNFSVSGTGRWEYQDGGASTGTTVSAQNFAKALAALYAYEGYSDQVRTVSTWLRSFTSNGSYETPANVSASVLARSTTGEYDATATMASLLLVRDSGAGYSAIKKNGSSLYDWGAFGLLSPIWGSQNTSSFTQSRTLPLGRNQRFFDGTRSDGDHFDFITLRGLSGLSMQTAFLSNTTGSYPGTVPFTAGSQTDLPGVGNGLVVKLFGNIQSSGATVTGWLDSSGLGQHYTADPGFAPETGLATIGGMPCVSFRSTIGAASAALVRTGGIRDRNGVIMGYNTGETQSITVMAVFRPTATLFDVHGGPIFHRVGTAQPPFQAIFDLEGGASIGVNTYWLWSRGWRSAADSIQGPNLDPTSYDGVTVLCEWVSSGFPNIDVAVDGVPQTLTPTQMPGVIGGATTEFSMIGDVLTGGAGLAFGGDIAGIFVWDYALSSGERSQARTAIADMFSNFGASVAMVNDVVRSSQFATSFRINPSFPTSV